MPVRPYRPPIRKPMPWVYHAGATARGVVDRGGRQVLKSAEQVSVDRIAQAINGATEALIHLLIVLSMGGLAIGIILLNVADQAQDAGGSFVAIALKLIGLNPSVFGLTKELQQLSGDMNDLGDKVQKGQVFNRFDGGTVAVNSGWGHRDTGIPGASKFHQGIDLPLEGGYPLFTWTQTEVICKVDGGYGNLATLKLDNGQVYQAGHLSSCIGGTYGPKEIYGRVGTTGVSSGNHLHWIQKNNLGIMVHPQTNPLQATVTGLWPGGGSSAIGGIDMEFIKKLEGGFHPTAYLDGSEGGRTRWSWGYGTKAPGPGQTITEEQAHQEMVAYLDRNCLPIIPDHLEAHQKTAAASLCYNVGAGVKNWNIWKEIEAGGNPKFTNYTKNTVGPNSILLGRRTEEQNMWDGKL